MRSITLALLFPVALAAPHASPNEQGCELTITSIPAITHTFLAPMKTFVVNAAQSDGCQLPPLIPSAVQSSPAGPGTTGQPSTNGLPGSCKGARNASQPTALPMRPLTALRRLPPAQTALTTRPLNRQLPLARMLFPLRPLLVQGMRDTARVQRLTPPTSTSVLLTHILLPELCSRLRFPGRTAQMETTLRDLRKVSPSMWVRPSESKR
ncbi:hypothetical protein CGCTS75_v012674 [Colletotrichum tropicale]|nr:hypothetical protein CGCTS75_v012674 [Colletotrichum tropicale]